MVNRLAIHLLLQDTVCSLAGHAISSFLNQLELIDMSKSFVKTTQRIYQAFLQSI